jgi:hypothetical protein
MSPESQDPFASVRIKKQEKISLPKDNGNTIPNPQETEIPQRENTSIEPIQNEQNEDPFESVRLKQPNPESWFETSVRGLARTGSRVLENIIGIPGDIQDLIQSGVLSGQIGRAHV